MGQLFIFVAVALLPALVLMKYIYNKDAIESEPIGLLIHLAVVGAACIFPVLLLESAGKYILDSMLPASGVLYPVLLMFLVVAPAEEGCKYFFLKRRTWNHPAFNYQFDGVVYAVFVSLGFAALENVGYVMQYGLSVAITRAIFSVPAHMGFAVLMGSFYGKAKVCQFRNDQKGVQKNQRSAVLIAVMLHGFYNTSLSFNTPSSLMAFIAFVSGMYILVIHRIKSDAFSDAAFVPIPIATDPLDSRDTEANS